MWRFCWLGLLLSLLLSSFFPHRAWWIERLLLSLSHAAAIFSHADRFRLKTQNRIWNRGFQNRISIWFENRIWNLYKVLFLYIPDLFLEVPSCKFNFKLIWGSLGSGLSESYPDIHQCTGLSRVCVGERRSKNLITGNTNINSRSELAAL